MLAPIKIQHWSKRPCSTCSHRLDRNRVFTVVEKWESEPALGAHLDAAHMHEHRKRVRDLATKTIIHVLRPVSLYRPRAPRWSAAQDGASLVPSETGSRQESAHSNDTRPDFSLTRSTHRSTVRIGRRPASAGPRAVPPTFRFSVKVPKAITHTLRLKKTVELLDTFIAESSSLGAKLGCFLVQLPPSLRFDPRDRARLLQRLPRSHHRTRRMRASAPELVRSRG